jgi:hypothetical protein
VTHRIRIGLLAAALAAPLACSSSVGGGAAVDGGTGDGSNPVGCPDGVPTSTTSCALPNGTTCSYATPNGGPCSGGTSAVCQNGVWTVTQSGGPPITGSCPATAPPQGSSCTPSCGAQASCTYDCAHCNGSNCVATCNGSTWSISTFASPCAGAEAGAPDTGPDTGASEGGADAAGD